MGITIRASDLKYRYPKAVQTRFTPKFAGSNDRETFNRDDLYDIIPVLEAAMDHLERSDATTLHFMEDLMNRDLPSFLKSRAEVFDFLTGSTKEMLEYNR